MTTEEIFNSAINFALDGADEEGLLFLRMWREGDWNGIKKEFPGYEIPKELNSDIYILDVPGINSQTLFRRKQ
jgi:hypothetical protein